MRHLSNQGRDRAGRVICLLLSALLVSFPAARSACAQEAEKPAERGMIDLAPFAALAGTDESLVEVSLSGSLLALATGSLAGQDPEIARSIAGLRAVNVVVVSLDEAAFSAAERKLADLRGRLTQESWTVVARVRDEETQVHLLLLEQEGRVSGLTVSVLDRDERQLVLVNIAGHFDPEHLGNLLEKLGAGVDLSQLTPRP